MNLKLWKYKKVIKDIDESFEANFIKLDELIKNKNSKTVIKSIRKDLNEHYYGLSKKLLKLLSTSIFYDSYLKNYNISEDDIIKYIKIKNIKYYNKLDMKEKKMFEQKANIRYIEYLITKYITIVNKNIKVMFKFFSIFSISNYIFLF